MSDGEARWHPAEDDLTDYMRRRLEEAYHERERPKCSREDFADGFLSALVLLRSRSSFKEGAWRDE